MARIRTIKPEFWSDDAVTECSLSARLLFIGTWNFADDAGNLDRSHKQLKTRVFPIDNVNCEPLIQELLTHGLLIEYSVSGKKYLHIPGFAQHQLINRPSKPVVPAYDESLRTHGVITDGSLSTHPVREGRGRKGEEGKGIYDAEGGSKGNALQIPNDTALMDAFAVVRSTYPQKAGRQDWITAEHHWRLRLDEGCQAHELLAAVERYAAFVAAGGVSGPQFVLGPEKFFSAADKPWLQPWAPPPSKAQAQQDSNIEAGREWLARGAADANS